MSKSAEYCWRTLPHLECRQWAKDIGNAQIFGDASVFEIRWWQILYSALNTWTEWNIRLLVNIGIWPNIGPTIVSGEMSFLCFIEVICDKVFFCYITLRAGMSDSNALLVCLTCCMDYMHHNSYAAVCFTKIYYLFILFINNYFLWLFTFSQKDKISV